MPSDAVNRQAQSHKAQLIKASQLKGRATLLFGIAYAKVQHRLKYLAIRVEQSVMIVRGRLAENERGHCENPDSGFRCRHLGGRSIAVLLATLLTATTCLSQVPKPVEAQAMGTPPAYGGELPSLAALNIRDARIETVLSGMDRPWAFEFIAENEVLITEIGGRLLRYRFGDDAPNEVTGLPPIATSQEQTGLLDLALHPKFAENRRIYFSYAAEDPLAPGYFLTKVSSAILGAKELSELASILEATPYGWSPSNFGGAMAFDRQGMLYVSVGDRSEHELSQQGNRLQGKILRLHDDGRTPSDNPFVDHPSIDDRIYALGVRNPQGLDFDSETGALYESEHGPLGGDEVNRIERGRNYGWPTITYGMNYNLTKLGQGTHAQRLQQPLYYYLPSIAASPLVVYRGRMFPQWQGDLLVGALKGEHVSWLDLDDDRVRSQQSFLGELRTRIRDIKIAADGAVFVLGQNGSLYRLYRQPEQEAKAEAFDPAVIYAYVCAGCHGSGAYEAPRIDHPAEWSTVLAQPLATTYQNTLEGVGNMPARGLCDLCSDDQLRATLDYLLDRVGKPKPTDVIGTPEAASQTD